jgi:hypothetical protein
VPIFISSVGWGLYPTVFSLFGKAKRQEEITPLGDMVRNRRNHDSCRRRDKAAMAMARRPCHARNKLKQIFLFIVHCILFIVFNYELSAKNSELKMVSPDFSDFWTNFLTV